MVAFISASVVTILCLLGSPLVSAHSYMAEPPARNFLSYFEGHEGCPHCLQGDGPKNVESKGEGVWPTRLAPQSHGLCGDPVQGSPNPASLKDEKYLVPTPVQRTYTAGQIVEFKIGVSTHHMGHYEFRICEHALDGQTLSSASAGQECLNKWLLERADPPADCVPNDPRGDCQPIDENHPDRWYLPPPHYGTRVAGANWSDAMAQKAQTARSSDANWPVLDEVHTMRYKIPAQLSCTHCTLQWYWGTGNNCLYDDGYFRYFKKMQAMGWDARSWAPWAVASWANCDNACCGPQGNGKFGEEFWNCADIAVLGSGSGPEPTSAPVPVPEPTPVPTLPPMPTPTPSPRPVLISDPIFFPTLPPMPTPSPTPVGDTCSEAWQQCGGQTWSGATCCQDGLKCHTENEWYSQCVPQARMAEVRRLRG